MGLENENGSPLSSWLSLSRAVSLSLSPIYKFSVCPNITYTYKRDYTWFLFFFA